MVWRENGQHLDVINGGYSALARLTGRVWRLLHSRPFCRPAFTENRMRGFSDFLASWEDTAHSRNRDVVALGITPVGNINQTGELGDYRGHALSRWHPQFEASLEPGIRSLVCLLVRRFNVVTYTSCEGHAYQGLPLKPVERHVGVLPLTSEQRVYLQALFESIGSDINRRYRRGAVRLVTVTHTLDVEAGSRAVLTLFFRRRRASWASYFRELDQVYRDTLAAFDRVAPSGADE